MPKRVGTAALFGSNAGVKRLQVPDNPLMPQYDFTVEGYVLLHSVAAKDEPRTIVSRWNGRKDQPGWSLGVSGHQAAGGARNVILELIGDAAEDGMGGYECLFSGLRLELDVPYYIAVSVRLGDTSETGITFYARELTAGAPLQTATRFLTKLPRTTNPICRW